MLWGGAAIVLTNVEGSVQPYIDTILLSKLTPAESVGLYGAARTFVGTLVAPAIIVSVAAYPRLSRAAFERGLLRRELGLLMRPVLGLAVLCSVGTFLFAQQAVDLVYGSSFAPAGTILRLLAPGFLLLFVDNMLGAAVVAVGRPQPLAVAMLLKIVACAGLTLVLAPQFQASHHNGGAGLAIASVVSEVVVFLAALLILPAGSLDPPALLPDLGRALTAGMGTLMLFGMLPTLPLVAGIPLCVLTFGALSVACGLVQPAELIALPRLLRQPRGERVL